jgi:hypothetical protein
MSKIERVCSTCKHEPSDEHCLGCTFDWKNADGNTHWEPEELDFNMPKKVVGKLISADILDKIAEEIEKEKKRQLEIALGINDANERRLHLRVEETFSYCLEIINKYREE